MHNEFTTVNEDFKSMKRDRTVRKTAAIAAVVLGALALLVFTLLMYSQTPAEQPPERIGVPAMENVSPE